MNLRAEYSRLCGIRDSLVTQQREVESRVRFLERDEQILDMVSALFRALIDQEVVEGVKAVEDLQTDGLREIFFDQSLSVKANVSESRGKISVDLVTCSELPDKRIIEGSPEFSFGGSVSSIESILLRITVIFRRGLRPLLLLDETLAAVANKYVDKASDFLSVMARRLGLDILMITHDPSFISAADIVYQVRDGGGHAVFDRVSSGGSKR